MVYFFYYVPLGMDIRLRRTPWVTAALIAAILVAYVVQRFDPLWLWLYETSFVYVPAAPRPSALFLNAYLHGDALHLASNLIALWVFGPVLEERLGSWRFLGLFHLANASANLVQGAWSLVFVPQSAEFGVVGASGAIAALMGLAIIRLSFASVRIGYWTFMPLQAFTRAGAVMLAVPIAVTLWFLLQIGILVIQSQGGGSQIAVGSHLGGLACGVAIALLAGMRDHAHAESQLHNGRRYARAGQWYAAQGHLTSYVELRPRDPEGSLELARALRVTNRHAEADARYRTACALLAHEGRWDRIEAAFTESARGNSEFVLEPRLQLHLAQLYERTWRALEAEEVYVRFARHYADDDDAALALFRAARLARDRGAQSTARDLLERIVSRYEQTCECELARAELSRTGPSVQALAA